MSPVPGAATSLRSLFSMQKIGEKDLAAKLNRIHVLGCNCLRRKRMLASKDFGISGSWELQLFNLLLVSWIIGLVSLFVEDVGLVWFVALTCQIKFLIIP